eukprot:scaffold275126_cov42-Prasinocladus_malaysianus.AAC.1
MCLKYADVKISPKEPQLVPMHHASIKQRANHKGDREASGEDKALCSHGWQAEELGGPVREGR